MARTVARSIFFAASARRVSAAVPSMPPASINEASSRVISQRKWFEQFLNLAAAVGERVEPHAHLVQQSQVQIRERRWFRIAYVAPALQLARPAPGDKNGQIHMVVLVAIT